MIPINILFLAESALSDEIIGRWRDEFYYTMLEFYNNIVFCPMDIDATLLVDHLVTIWVEVG